MTSLDELDSGVAALSAPDLGAAISAIDSAESVLLVGADPLHAMPILDLRLRKAVRHSGLRLVIASERPTALDGGAEETARYLPGEGADFLATARPRNSATARARAATSSAWPASCGRARRW